MQQMSHRKNRLSGVSVLACVYVCVAARTHARARAHARTQHTRVGDQWVELPHKGNEPEPRCGAACVVVGDYLYVYGGYTLAGHTNDLYRVDFKVRL